MAGMKCGVLFSGGKDSTYSAYLAAEHNYKITCLISVFSENPESYMFHTPSITQAEEQAKAMGLPLVIQKTQGKKEAELEDLEKAIIKAKEEFNIEGIITGALQSIYQASRIQKICNKLNLECFNPLWQIDAEQYLMELIKNKFKVIITGVFAYPLDSSWLGREIDEGFLKDIKELNKKYGIHIAGEGGEFETFVLDCPLFKKPLEITNTRVSGSGNSWRMEVEVR